MRNNRNKRGGKVLGESVATAEDVAAQKPSGGSSAYGSVTKPSPLLPAPVGGFITSPFGEVYLNQRTKPIPADAVQVWMEAMRFRIQGYSVSGVSSAGLLNEYTAGETLLADWYTYGRQMGKASLKYKHTPTTLDDYTRVQDFFNIAFFALADLTMLGNLNHLYQYNQAFSSVYSYVPDKMSRCRRLWERLSTVFLPSELKAAAMKAGMIAVVPGVFPPYVRVWTPTDLVMYGAAADYNDPITSQGIQPTLISNTYLTQFIDDIESAIWVLEGKANLTLDSGAAEADVIAIKDLIDMMHDVGAGTFSQGLPDFQSLPGLLEDRSLYNDLLSRSIFILDSHGGDGDEFSAFPVVGDSALNNHVPIVGWGTPGVEEFTLLGGPKLATMNSTGGAYEAGAADEYLLYGTHFANNINTRQVEFYTREDGWSAFLVGGADLGDGTILGNLLDGGHPWLRHAFLPAILASQRSIELRFLDNIDRDYRIYVDESDFGPNYAKLLGTWLGVPYLK